MVQGHPVLPLPQHQQHITVLQTVHGRLRHLTSAVLPTVLIVAAHHTWHLPWASHGPTPSLTASLSSVLQSQSPSLFPAPPPRPPPRASPSPWKTTPPAPPISPPLLLLLPKTSPQVPLVIEIHAPAPFLRQGLAPLLAFPVAVSGTLPLPWVLRLLLLLCNPIPIPIPIPARILRRSPLRRGPWRQRILERRGPRCSSRFGGRVWRSRPSLRHARRSSWCAAPA
mmetsp:Transcript_19375/g.34533  ORF Transcript_19375/g.34533 Transcript_19375/m.34533 type:complete len:225 (+) Transcript_19375:59-733(+)